MIGGSANPGRWMCAPGLVQAAGGGWHALAVRRVSIPVHAWLVVAAFVAAAPAAASGQAGRSAAGFGTGTRPASPPPEERATIPLSALEAEAACAPLDTPALDPNVARQVDAALAAAEEQLDRGALGSADAELQRAMRLAPTPTRALLVLYARVRWAQQRTLEARMAAELAVRNDPGNVRARRILARIERDRGNRLAALGWLQPLIGRLSAPPRAGDGPEPTVGEDLAEVLLLYRDLGEILAGEGFFLAAAQAWERLDVQLREHADVARENAELAEYIERHPNGALEERLDLLERAGRPEERVRVAEEALARRGGWHAPAVPSESTAPDDPYLVRVYVKTLVEAGQAERAFDFCQTRLRAGSSDPAAEAEGGPATRPVLQRQLLADLAIEAAAAAGVLRDWVMGLVDSVGRGKDIDLAEQVARRLEDTGGTERERQRVAHNELAVLLWRALLERQPETPERVWSLAAALRRSNQLVPALEVLIVFVRNHPAQADIPPARLADWSRAFRDTTALMDAVREFLSRDDADFATHYLLGVATGAAEQTELAERLLHRASELQPDFALAHVARARLLARAYRWQDALAQADEALAIEKSLSGDRAAAPPHMAAAYAAKAEAHAGLDQHDAAEAAFKQAIALAPGNANYVLGLARQYRRTGNLLAAQRYYQQAWTLEPTMAEAAEELLDSYLDGGKIAIARTVLQDAMGLLPEDALRRMRTAVRFGETMLSAAHLEELRRQFAEYPADSRTGLKLAAGLFLSHQPDAAHEVLEKIEARAPEDEVLLYLRTRVHLRRLEYDAAIRLLEDAAQRYPRRASVLKLLADAYRADFRFPEARDALRRLLALETTPPEQSNLRRELLDTHLSVSEFEPALELIETWLAGDLSAPRAETREGNEEWVRTKLAVLVMAGQGERAVALARERLAPFTRRFEEARDRLQDLTAQATTRPEDLELRAIGQKAESDAAAAATALYERRAEFVRIAVDARAFEDAERAVREWLEEQPEIAEVRKWLVEILVAARRGAEALDEIAKLTPSNPMEIIEALLWRARAYVLAGKRAQAIDELGDLLQQNVIAGSATATAQVRQELLSILVEAGQIERAIELCDRWLGELPPGDLARRYDLLNLKRFVLLGANQLEEGTAVLEELLSLRPHDPGINNDLGYTWVDRGERVERAFEMIKLAVAAQPLNAAYLDSLGWAYYKRGAFAEAREQLDRATRLRDGQDATVFDHLGDAEWRLGHRAAARRAWEKAMELIGASPTEGAQDREVQLKARLRAKLDALDTERGPRVSPTAAEQSSKTIREPLDEEHS